MAKIFLSVPILGKPELKMIYSMYQAILSCKEHQVRVYFNENDSLISRVRNVHISAFLFEYTDCDYFMSLDSDLEIMNCYGNNNIFTKLINNDVDWTGGLYAVKNPDQKRCASIPIDGGDLQFDTGVKEMRWLSSGCWCIKRSVIEKMYDAYPELIYNGDDNAAGKKVLGIYIPFLYKVKEGDFGKDNMGGFVKYLSEDWSACERWKQIGGKIHVDTSIALKHWGKKPYVMWDLEVVKKENQEKQQKQELPKAGFDLKK